MHWLNVAVALLVLCPSSCAPHAISQRCKARKVVKNIVDVDEITHPRTVNVFECSGYTEARTHARRNYKCVPTKRGVITKPFYRFSTHSLENKTFVNHSKCEMKCVCELNGYACSADDTYQDEVPCPDGSEWSSQHCRCKSIQPKEKNRSCNLQGNDEGGGISAATFVACLIAELIIIIIIMYIIKDCRTRGCLYRNISRARSTATLRPVDASSAPNSPNEKTNLSVSDETDDQTNPSR